MDQTIQRFQQLWTGGDYAALERLLHRARAAEATDDVLVWSAMCARARGDLHAAYRHIARVVQRAPRNPEPHALLARIAEDLQMPELRLQGWQAAVNAEPDNMKYRVALAKHHADMGNPEFGKAVIETLQKTNASVRASEAGAAEVFGPPLPLAEDAVVVLLPVYDDFEVTRACIESVLESLPHNTCPAHLLVINDASPSTALYNWLQVLAATTVDISFELLEHRVNRGFLHTVNAGLARYPAHDAVLLNADTLVWEDWLDRLQRAACRDDRVASVTPLSNFGELASFPHPMRDNPLRDDAQVARVHGIAREVNDGQAVEIPVGVGFCLYLRAEALGTAGLLDDENYDRGYGEEVDLCLRFRQHGFKNLCAADVFVGHRGTTSFKAEKPILAARNNKRLYRRYPTYRQEYQAFLHRDPLAPHRRAIEQHLLRQLPAGVHHVRANPTMRSTRERRIAAAREGEPLLVSYRDYSEPGVHWRVELDDVPGAASLAFESEQAMDDELAGNGVEGAERPAPAPGSRRLPWKTREGTWQVIAVLRGPSPLEEYRVIESVARHITVAGLPYHLWLQYRTINDLALANLGSVTPGDDWAAVTELQHWRGGGAGYLWQPDAGAPCESAGEIEAIIHGWH